MRRPILSVLLLTGAIAGFVSGTHRAFGDHRSCRTERHEAFYDRVADVCVRAAERAHERPEPGAP
jgi:hypothetical protein